MIRELREHVAQLPWVRWTGKAYYERQFVRWPGAFRGVYGSFEEATRSAPRGSRVGYDFDELGDMYQDRLFRIFPADYPVLFWLSRILAAGSKVFDFGGHVGLAYYAFEKYLNFPRDLRWSVYDVPRVVHAGNRLLNEHPRAGLRFTTQLAEAAQHDVFHASGALQYVETSLAQLLRDQQARPQHILLNKVPLHESRAFVTLQNTMHSYNPYAVFERQDFVESLRALGYELRDAWLDLERSCRVPFHPELHVPAYSGLYFYRSSTAVPVTSDRPSHGC